MCVTTFMGLHTLVEQQISNILLLIYSVLLIRILFEAIAQKCWVLLCFVLCFFLFCVFFSLFPPFHYLDAELRFILACEGDFSGTDRWWWLSGCPVQDCPSRMQGHTGRCRWPQRPTALMLPDSCDRIQEELWAGACLGPVLLFLVLLWKIKLSSTLNILLGNGNGKHHLPAACLVVVAKPWVSLCRTATLVGPLEQILGAVGKG